MKRTPKKPRALRWSWDSETKNWDEPVCAAAVREDGERVCFWGEDCFSRMGSLMAREGGDWCAHYGGGFDVPLLIDRSREPRLTSLVLSGSTILCADAGNRLHLRDTWPATLASLAKIGKWVGIEKMDVDRGALETIPREVVEEYCIRDCEILDAGVNAFQTYLKDQGARKSWTAGSAAVALLKALEPGTWHDLARNACDGETIFRALTAVRGGRVECWARGHVPIVYSYDVKSSYPSRYNEGPLGIGLRKARPGDVDGLFRCSWYWPHRNRRPPVLDDRTGAGAGHCENWLCGEEMQLLKDLGVKVKIAHGWAPVESIPIGVDFCQDLYSQKEAGSPWAKVFLNSLHGKFAESPLKEKWTRKHPDAFFGPAPRRLGKRGGGWWRYHDLVLRAGHLGPPHSQPIAAGQILGRARVGLYVEIAALEAAGWDVYYCDTDCVHTNCPPSSYPRPLGDTLGSMAVEVGEPCEAVYLGPKAYILRDPHSGEIVKSALKGVPLKALARGVRVEGIYREAAHYESGSDLRWAVFEDAARDFAEISKEGVTGFLTGLNHGERWRKRTTSRRVRPTGRGKKFHPTDARKWSYLTPEETNAL